MDNATQISTGKPVTGEDLWYMEAFSHSDFRCPDCGLPVIPCSYNQDVNLRHPYFRAHKGAEHSEGCQYADNMEALRRQAQEESISGADGFPFSYPSRFNIDEPTTTEVVAEDNGAVGQGRRSQAAAGTGSDRQPHQYRTTSFRSIVNHYLNFPHDRDLPLSVRGIVGNTYQGCFHPIRSPEGEQTFLFQTENKIYFAPASWRTPEREGDVLSIEMSRGFWVTRDDKPSCERPYYVQVDMTEWPELTREAFLYEFEKALHDIRGDTSKKLLVFFIGSQDREEDYYRFFVDDPRLITVKVVSNG